MEQEKTERAQAGGKGRIAVLVLLVLVVFCTVVMGINSRKPQVHNFEGLDKRISGADFIKANEMLVKDMTENWLPNALFWPTAASSRSSRKSACRLL